MLICMALSASAAPRRVTIYDHLGLDWSDELVHYELAFAKGAVTGVAVARVEDAGGTAIPCQVSDVVRDVGNGSIRSMKVWFVVDVPANGSASFTIAPGAESPSGSGVVVRRTGDTVELATGGPQSVRITVPGKGKEFVWPVSADSIPAPIQALTLPSGKRIGPARLDVPFRVKSYDVRVTAKGPLFAEVRVHYLFNVGEWTFKARVIKDCPMILIDEELNTGNSGTRANEFDRFWTLVVNSGGFSPTQAFYGSNNHDTAFNGLVKDAIPDSDLAKAGGVRGNWFASRINGYRLSFDEDRHDYSLTGYATAQQRVGCLIRYVEPGGDAIGFAGLDTPYWRNTLALRFDVSAQGQVLLRVPVQVYSQRWHMDGMESISPNYTGVVRYVPEDTVRRRYGIMLSRAEDETKCLLGSLFSTGSKLSAMPLDRVKDWVLDWPDPMAGANWSADPTPEGKKALDALRAKIAVKRAFGNFALYSMGYHFGYAKSCYPHLAKVIDSPASLTAEERAELRRLCAFYAYDMHSLDTFPYGMGFHLNNPNMTIMAIEARVKSSSLISDHPRFKDWGEWSRELLGEYLARFTKPSGAPFENPHYTLGVTMNWAIQANELLIENGLGDGLDSDLFRRSMRFVMNWLTPPDPRFKGHRVVLPIGNGSYQSVPQDFTGRYVKYFKDRDPGLAAQLQWFGNQTMPDSKKVHLVDEAEPELKSGWYKDYGVIFRHGFGTPHETLMHFLAGTCFGHYECETDQMAYTIYAKGQPIHLHFGNGYFPMYNRPWLRNRVSFDMRMEAPERNRIEVETASFSPETEYLRAVREVEQLLPRSTEYPLLDKRNRWTPEESANWRRCIAKWDAPESSVPLTIWSRQMLFVKDPDPSGPNYFVLRDTFGGKPTVPTDLSLWFLANEMDRQGNVFHFDGQCEVDMDVFVNTPDQFTPHTDQYGHQQQPYRRHTGFDPKHHPGGKRWESQLLLRIRQPAEKGYLVVLYPRLKADEPAATFCRLARNALLVETPTSRDYVFLNPHPLKFRNDEVTFSGTAASVRLNRSGRLAVANSEGEAQVTVAGRKITGTGAFVVTIDGEKIGTATYGEGSTVKAE